MYAGAGLSAGSFFCIWAGRLPKPLTLGRMPLELEDHQWFPAWMRRYQMEAISAMVRTMRVYQPLAPLVGRLLTAGGGQWTDCCTGAAGPVYALWKAGCRPTELWLADKYPMPPVWRPATLGEQLVEADVLDDELPGKGLITLFNAFHHFSPLQRQQLLNRIAQSRRPLLIAEITAPNVVSLSGILLATTVGHILLAPFIQPFSWRRLLFTYLIPINLLTVWWDGMMSVCFAVRPSSFRKLAATCSSTAYRVHYTTAGPWWQRVHILYGEAQSVNDLHIGGQSSSA